MNVRPDLRMSKAAFIEWDAGEGQRCELVVGRVVHDAAAIAGSRNDRHQIGHPGKSYTAGAPIFLTEVLSPSKAEIDLGDKAAEYLQVPSLHAYIVLSQDEPKAWVLERTGSLFASGPAVVSGADAAIGIVAL